MALQYQGRQTPRGYEVRDKNTKQILRVFPNEASALKWIEESNKPKDPTEGMSEDQKRLYRLREQIGTPQELAMDSSRVYKHNLPEYTPMAERKRIRKERLEKIRKDEKVLAEKERKAEEKARKFVPGPMDKSEDFDSYIKGVDPVSISEELEEIDMLLDNYRGNPKYKTLFSTLSKRKVELVATLKDYDKHKSNRNKQKPKIYY